MGEKLYYKNVEIRAVNIRQPSTSRKAKTLRKVRETKATGDEYHDQRSERQTASRVAIPQALPEKHLQSPVTTLHKALRRTGVVDRAESSAAGGSRNILGVPHNRSEVERTLWVVRGSIEGKECTRYLFLRSVSVWLCATV